MKNELFAVAVLAASVAAFCACNKEPLPSEAVDRGTIELSVEIPGNSPGDTRTVTAYTETLDGEKKVNGVQYFIFRSASTTDHSKNVLEIDAAMASDASRTVESVTGSHIVWALVNGPGNLKFANEKQLLDYTACMKLEKNGASSFLMAGSRTVSVAAGAAADGKVTVSRFVSRVALREVVNKLPAAYGAVKIVNAFLINVVAVDNVGGNMALPTDASLWYNKEGRKDASRSQNVFVTSASTASAPDMTFKALGSVSVASGGSVTPESCNLYAYRNSSTDEPDGWHTTFKPRQTALVLQTLVNSGSGEKTFYYTVPLKAFDRNCAITVGLTLNHLGSEAPGAVLEIGSINASVTVADWTTGAVYNETI